MKGLDALYAAFSRFPCPTRLTGCPCCVDDACSRRLTRTPLRALEPEALGRYAFKAMSTWGTELDYAYFAPRILELSRAGHDAFPGLGVDVVVRKLRDAGLETWPADVRDAVDAFFAAWADEVAGSWRALELLEGASPQISDPGAFVKRWAAAAGPVAVADAMLGRWVGQGDFFDRDAPLSWRGTDVAGRALVALFRDPATHASLEGALAATSSGEDAEVLAAALEALEAFR